MSPTDRATFESDDDHKIDRTLMQKLPIGAHLLFENISYDMVNVKQFSEADNSKNDIADIRTRKPIRWLTTQ